MCGSDRRPYANDCLATDAGARVACLGACPCAYEEERVRVAAGGGVPSGAGAEVPNPVSVPDSVPAAPELGSGPGSGPLFCPAIFRPVCSSAGTDHSNDCAARAAGQAVACKGPCP